MPYIMQSILLLLGPTFFAASIYMILGRIIRLTNGEAHSIVRATLVTKIFLIGDTCSFLAQSAGLCPCGFTVSSSMADIGQVAACWRRRKPKTIRN